MAPGAKPEPSLVLPEKPMAQSGKRPAHRPVKYRDEFPQMLRDYFNRKPYKLVKVVDRSGRTRKVRQPNLPPTLARFAAMIGVSRETIHAWATDKLEDGKTLRYPDFSDAVSYAKAAQEACLMEGGVIGVYNPFLTQFALKNYSDLKDKVESAALVEYRFPDEAELDRIYAEGMRKAALLNAKVGKGPLAGGGASD